MRFDPCERGLVRFDESARRVRIRIDAFAIRMPDAPAQTRRQHEPMRAAGPATQIDALVKDDAGFMFEPTRAKRETEARELLGQYVSAASGGEREAQRESIVRLLISRQGFETAAQEEASAEMQYGFLDKIDAGLQAYVEQSGDEQRAALIRLYRSFVRRLALPHHYA